MILTFMGLQAATVNVENPKFQNVFIRTYINMSLFETYR